jgi:hypothetical protein
MEEQENHLHKIIDNAKAVISWLGGLSPFIRLIIASTFGAFGGSTFVGFLNTYALYNYAYSYGSRVPVEGVPYLG